jgi:hypothetical protein
VSDVVVFLGPSLPATVASDLVPGADIRPPVRRGELRAARADGARILVVIDGAFAHSLAVSPREVVDVLRSGAIVIGASSMGAIRAAECEPAGMIGIGEVYAGFRDGRLVSDDEVAVVTDPDTGHRAVSVPLVAVRSGLCCARADRAISAADARALLAAAESLHFSERQWLGVVLRARRPRMLAAVLAAYPHPGADFRSRPRRGAARTISASARGSFLQR